MPTVHILGSGCPTPTVDRFGTSFAIETDDGLIMVDCGPSATWKLCKAGLSAKDVQKLYLTHHHFDHNVDTPCLLLTRWDQNSESGKPIHVYGPQPTVEFCDKIVGSIGAFQPDWYARTKWEPSLSVFKERGGVLPRLPPNVQALDITPGWTDKCSSYTVTAGYADHAQPYLDCLAYRFDFANKSVVFTGDTGLCDEIVELAKGVDYMFCMSSGADMNQSVGQRQCVPGAADPRDAGVMAKRAGVKNLVLVHQGPGQAHPDKWQESIDKAAAVYQGNVIFGCELTKFEV